MQYRSLAPTLHPKRLAIHVRQFKTSDHFIGRTGRRCGKQSDPRSSMIEPGNAHSRYLVFEAVTSKATILRSRISMQIACGV